MTRLRRASHTGHTVTLSASVRCSYAQSPNARRSTARAARPGPTWRGWMERSAYEVRGDSHTEVLALSRGVSVRRSVVLVASATRTDSTALTRTRLASCVGGVAVHRSPHAQRPQLRTTHGTTRPVGEAERECVRRRTHVPTRAPRRPPARSSCFVNGYRW
jgi:hypothetical protein